MIDWVKYLRETEKFPVKYLSLHNEGDSPYRWPLDGSSGNIGKGHDYNAFWRPAEVAHFIGFMRPLMDEMGLKEVGITPGECSNWRNVSGMLYDWAIFDNPQALKNIGLLTSHGFGAPDVITSTAADLLRFKRPDLHAWTTSYSWGRMDVSFIELSRQNIYAAEVNALIPWAFIQTLTWVGGDPNPGCAVRVSATGDYTIQPGYYFYKQLSRAGQPGMAVAAVATTSGSQVELIAFASNGTANPDAFVVLNTGRTSQQVKTAISGSSARSFKGFRTNRQLEEKYADIGTFEVRAGSIEFELPAGAVATFFANVK
jgi:hypothetical protein